MVSDPIGDFIVRLANGGAARKETVSVPFSNFKLAIAEKLKEAGYVMAVEKRGKKVKKTIDVTLKYRTDGSHAIEGVKRISKPGRRLYAAVNEIHPVRYGHGLLILSTPAGVMTGKEAAKAKVGGETLFEIW
jgi:small subunit ribosomal protein S8